MTPKAFLVMLFFSLFGYYGRLNYSLISKFFNKTLWYIILFHNVTSQPLLFTSMFKYYQYYKVNSNKITFFSGFHNYLSFSWQCHETFELFFTNWNKTDHMFTPSWTLSIEKWHLQVLTFFCLFTVNIFNYSLTYLILSFHALSHYFLLFFMPSLYILLPLPT